MKIELQIKDKHIAYLLVTVLIVAGINFAIAQTSVPDPGHGANGIGPGTFAGSSSDTWVFPGTVQANSFIGAVPAGAIMAFNLSTCPSGWVLADGSGGTPDLRGVFIRGLDDGSAGQDPDAPRPLGSFQGDMFESHTHTLRGGPDSYADRGYLGDSSDRTSQNLNSLSSTGGSETRPKNVALIYCMKT